MARGRKKDLSLPLTPTLLAQRNFRDRRAKRLASLEERCRISEDEAAKLRIELAAARLELSKGDFPPGQTFHNPDVCKCCRNSEVEMRRLRAELSVARHRPREDLEYSDAGVLNTCKLLLKQLSATESAVQQFQDSITKRSSVARRPVNLDVLAAAVHFQSMALPRPDAYGQQADGASSEINDIDGKSSENSADNLESECCGGILDCTGLLEETDIGSS